METTENPNGCSVAVSIPPSWRRRLGWVLFPQKRPELPKAPAEWKDCLHFNFVTELSWHARLCILFTGRISGKALIVCQNETGASMSSMEVDVPPPAFLA